MNKQTLIQYSIDIDEDPRLAGKYGDDYAEVFEKVVSSSVTRLLGLVSDNIEVHDIPLPDKMTLKVEWLEEGYSSKLVVRLERRKEGD